MRFVLVVPSSPGGGYSGDLPSGLLVLRVAVCQEDVRSLSMPRPYRNRAEHYDLARRDPMHKISIEARPM